MFSGCTSLFLTLKISLQIERKQQLLMAYGEEHGSAIKFKLVNVYLIA